MIATASISQFSNFGLQHIFKMTSLAVGPLKKNLKEEKASLKKDEDLEVVAFETEVLYERIEELETELQRYKQMIERIKHILTSQDDVRVQIEHILKPNLKRNIEIID